MVLAVPFKTRKYMHRLIAYDRITQILSNHNMTMHLQILNNISRN